VIDVADIDLPRGDTRPLDLRMAAQAEVRVAVNQQLSIDRSVRAVASRAPFAHRFMLEYERLGLFPVTLCATLVSPRHGESAGGSEYIHAVRIMALNAIHMAFENGMMLRQAELAMDIQVTLEAGGGVFTRVDDEFPPAAAGLDVFAAGAVAGFAPALAFEHGVIHVNARVRTGGKGAHIVGVAIDASRVADIMRARHNGRDKGIFRQAAAGTEYEQPTQCDNARDKDLAQASFGRDREPRPPAIAGDRVAEERRFGAAVIGGARCFRMLFHRRRIQGSGDRGTSAWIGFRGGHGSCRTGRGGRRAGRCGCRDFLGYGNRFEHFANDHVREISAKGEGGLEMPAGVDDERAEVMIEQAGVTLDFDARGPGQFVDLLVRTRQETPPLGVVMVTPRIFLEHGGRVEIRVERHGNEMPVGGSIRHGRQALRSFLEVA
jgi:hypothetical protein